MMKKEKIERVGRNREGGGGAERKNGKKPPIQHKQMHKKPWVAYID